MLNENFRKIRIENGMSLYDVAKKSGVAYSILYNLEHTKKDITITTALKIAKALGVTLNDLVKEN